MHWKWQAEHVEILLELLAAGREKDFEDLARMKGIRASFITEARKCVRYSYFNRARAILLNGLAMEAHE